MAPDEAPSGYDARRHDPRRPPPSELNLVTLNCWGLLHLSALRTPRLAEIGRQLAALQPPPDVVCLQECWTQADYRAVRRHCREVLPYGKFYHAGAFGAGLVVLSRWPLEHSSMMCYPLNGRPTAFFRGDWFVGKGVACATIRFGPGKEDVLEVFNTHTHAPYEREPGDSYLCHRTAQAWEMSKLLRGAASRGHLALALGDFNMLPLSLAHRLITAHAPVRDVWRVLRPDSSLGPAHHPAERARGRPVPSAAFNLLENGAASDGPYNTWRWSSAQQKRVRAGDPCPVDQDGPDPRGKRLDYIFASAGGASTQSSGPGHRSGSGSSSGPTISAPAPGWVVSSASVAMTDRHPELHVSLSDHFAVRATLHRHDPAIPGAASGPSRGGSSTDASALRSGAYLATDSPPLSAHGTAGSPEDYDTQLRRLRAHPDAETRLAPAVYDEVLDVIRRYAARETRQRYWRGLHFYASVIVWVACLVAVWFSPANFVAFLLMLLASLGLTAGVIDGLLALLFFSSEIRALKEFGWEIRNAKALASGDAALPAEVDADDKPDWDLGS